MLIKKSAFLCLKCNAMSSFSRKFHSFYLTLFKDYMRLYKVTRFQSNHHNSHNQSFSLIPYMVYFAKINPREIFGKPQFAKINPREMQIFWTRENKSSRKYVLLRYYILKRSYSIAYAMELGNNTSSCVGESSNHMNTCEIINMSISNVFTFNLYLQ